MARSGTGCESIRPPDRGGKGGRRGRGEGEGEDERDEEGRGANNLVSWRNVRGLRPFAICMDRRVHGGGERRAVTARAHDQASTHAELCWHACRATNLRLPDAAFRSVRTISKLKKYQGWLKGEGTSTRTELRITSCQHRASTQLETHESVKKELRLNLNPLKSG